MSSLICFSNDDVAVIATDTLGVDDAGKPFVLTNKASYLHTLKTVICGTGAGGFHSKWAEIVNSRMILSGIDNLDFHTPDGLRQLWSDFKKEFKLNEKLTVTVYQIGFSLETGKLKRFAYRSTNNFSSEELDQGWFYKPECEVHHEENVIDIIKKMMFEQRKIQEAKPKHERVYIGGQVNAIILERECTRHLTVADFPDFEECLKEIFNPN